jgi:hypothetical protein
MQFESISPFPSSEIEVKSPTLLLNENATISSNQSDYYWLGHIDKLRVSNKLPDDYSPDKSVAILKQYHEHRTGSLMGVIIDRATNKPIEGADVFINYSTLRTKTRDDGKFVFKSIPAGTYHVVATKTGFRISVKDLPTDNHQKSRDTIFLASKPLINENNIEKNERRKYLDEFNQQLINQSSQKDLRIENEEVIDVFNINGKVKYTAKAPLQIVNKSLGYRITFYLQQTDVFKGIPVKQGEIRGLCYYESLDTLFKNAIVEQNRLEAYDGSLLHFSRSVLSGRYRQNNFKIFTKGKELDLSENLFTYDSIQVNSVIMVKPFSAKFMDGSHFTNSNFKITSQPFCISGYGIVSAYESKIPITGPLGRLFSFPTLPLDYVPSSELPIKNY